MPPISEPNLPVALHSGRVVFGRYTLRSQLGRGGMGVVWHAHDKKLDRPVALKFLSDALFLDAASRDELKRETRRSLDLTHPNIVRIYDFLEDEETAAISMEYVEGSTLSGMRVERSQRCFEADGLGIWMADLCRALDYAHHTALVVHRDLKPANLLVGASGHVKVADFGIACSLQNTAARVSAWNCSGGTLGYMSPQQLCGDLASPADDIYSIGATIYELLTGKPPFYSGDISLQIRTVKAESMTVRRQQFGIAGEPIPARWEEAVAACLAKRPADRPTSAEDLAGRLGLDLTPTRQGASAPEMVTLKSLPMLEEPALLSKCEVAWKDYRVRAAIGTVAIAMIGLATVSIRKPSLPTASVVPVSTAATSTPTQEPEPLKVVVTSPPGGLMIKTDPPGATVSAGTKTVISPGTIDHLPAGPISVRVEMENFEPQVISSQIPSGEFVNLGVVALSRSTGSLDLLSEPQDAIYTLRPKVGDVVIRQGRTPDSVSSLPTGEYMVRMEKPGWPAEEHHIEVERQTTRRVLSRFGEGSLEVSSDPAGATVLLADREIGRTPLTVKLPSGRQGPFTVRLDGWEPATFDATVPLSAVATQQPIVLKPQAPVLEITTDPPGIPFRLFSGAVESPNAQPTQVGDTPATLSHLAAGPYRVIFDAAPWPSRSSAIELAERGATRFHQAFPHGTVKVESIPSGAEIFIGEASLGETPLEIPLPAGAHILTAELGDKTSRPRTITVKDDGVQSARFDFRSAESSSGPRRPRRPKKSAAEEPALTKIGRTLKSFFTGEKSKR